MSVWAIATSSIQSHFQMRSTAARRYVPGAPEIYFNKAIDNSRLVKLDDPERRREIRMFTLAMSVIFVLCTMYVWQHFRSIEYGYNIEAARAERDRLTEENRELRLEEATLKSPDRIDAIARKMGFEAPQAGQVQHMDGDVDSGVPVMARAAGVSVVSLSQ